MAFSHRFPVSLAAAAFILIAGAARAEDSERTFLMPEHDGYGVGDCLAAGPNSACGRVVADAWCESKGFAKAKTFGRSDPSDVTGSTGAGRAVVQPARQSTPMVVITCDG